MKILTIVMLMFQLLQFPQTGDAQEVTKKEKYLSFDDLDKIERFEELPKYGLLPPNIKNHKAGKNLILLALKVNAFFKGDWVMAHGLLGVTMIDVDVVDYIAYRSLFLSPTQSSKMYASYICGDGLLRTTDGSVDNMKSKSIVTKREAAIYMLATELTGRYIYNSEGNFERHYFPESGRKSNERLGKVFVSGLKVYSQLKEMGFDDETLRDTLGMVYASLDYDEVRTPEVAIYQLGSLQVYRDALEATLLQFRKRPDHSYQFLEELSFQMQSRGLACEDKVLLPDNEKNFKAMLKIIQTDLDNIKKK